MIYEVRTYDLKPSTVQRLEEKFADALPYREKYSKLAAFWHTDVGPLNQVVQVWPYNDLSERDRVRTEAFKDPHWPPHVEDYVLRMNSEIFIPSPFMRPMGGDQILGNVYEMRIYTYQINSIPEVIKRWAEAVPHREKYSPLAAAMYSELGGLNKWVHIWPYKDLNERNRVRAEAIKDPHWPPPTGEFMVHQENKILVPAAFSPMH